MPLGRLTIDLSAIAANWRLLRDTARPAQTAAVVKADAYGLGIKPVAETLWVAGCREFFVATLDEAVELRAVLAEATIGVLGAPVALYRDELLAHRLQPVLNHPGDWDAWRQKGGGAGAWLHLDTGMHRLGFSPKEWAGLLEQQPDWAAVGIRGLLTHYACADEPEHPLNAEQRDRAHAAARASGLPLSLANSAGIFLGPSFRGDLVRPGMAIYGLNPTPHAPNPMRRTVTLEVQVLQVRAVDEAGSVGYGASAAAAPGQVLATIGLGYADGWLRSLSNAGRVFFDGQPATIAGRVSMDSIVADVTRLARRPRPGDWVEIIGPHQSPDEVADAAGTIGYEVLTSLGHRYARTYTRGPETGA